MLSRYYANIICSDVMCARARARVCARVGVCARARVRACVRACLRARACVCVCVCSNDSKYIVSVSILCFLSCHIR